MPFRFLNDKTQKKLSTSGYLLPALVLIVGIVITFTVANRFNLSEKQFKIENLKSNAREFSKLQNLTLNNNILKIQSFNDLINLSSLSRSQRKEVIQEIIANSIFTRVSIYKLGKKSESNLPVLNLVEQYKTAENDLFYEPERKLKSQHILFKIKKMTEEGLSNAIALTHNENRGVMALIWRSTTNKDDFLVLEASVQNFFKEVIMSENITVKVKDELLGLSIYFYQNAENKDLKISIENEGTLTNEELSKTNTSVAALNNLIFSNWLINESYDITINWYLAKNPTASNYVLTVVIFGFAFSILFALFLHFILDQNRRIYKLVVSRTEELEQAMNRAQEANQAKTRFLANISHELRTPLNLILGMIELLQTAKLDQKNIGYLKSLQSAGEHLLNLITDLLSMTKEDSSDLEVNRVPFNIPLFFEEIGSIVGPECIRKKLKFQFYISHDVPYKIYGDPVKIRQIILNLLRNSLKYTTHGGITLHIEKIKNSKNQKNLSQIRFKVTDTGVGIPKNKMQHIFDRFFQIESSKVLAEGGVGLGLSIVKDLVSKMNGNITVNSEVGVGSCFSVDLDLEHPDDLPWVHRYHFGDGATLKSVSLISADNELFNCISAILPTERFKIEKFSWQHLSSREKVQKIEKSNFIILSGADESLIVLIQKRFADKKIVVLETDADSPLIKKFPKISFISATPVMPSALFDQLDFVSIKTKMVDVSEAVKSLEVFKLQVEDLSLQKLSILAVDDDSGNRELIKAYLDSPAFELQLAENGQQAFELYLSSKPDVIIADLRMPVMNGFELADAIRKHEKNERMKGVDVKPTPIILLTADALEETHKEAKKYEISNYLTKPIRRAKLIETIKNTRTHSTYH